MASSTQDFSATIEKLTRRTQEIFKQRKSLVNSINVDASYQAAALNQTITTNKITRNALFDITDDTNADDNGDVSVSTQTITMDEAKYYPIRLTGENQLQFNQSTGADDMLMRGMEFAVDTHMDYLEGRVAALHTQASRAITPASGGIFFSGDTYADLANLKTIQSENKLSALEHSLCMQSLSANQFLANRANVSADKIASSEIVDSGLITRATMGIDLKESALIVRDWVAGDGATLTTDAAGYPAGSTLIEITGASGEIKAGDVLSFASDPSRKYVVKTGKADVTAGGTVELQSPGLYTAIPASAQAVTLHTESERNMVLHPKAVTMLLRTPAQPPQGGNTKRESTIVDPNSGISFHVRLVGENNRDRWEIGQVSGVNVDHPEYMQLAIQNPL